MYFKVVYSHKFVYNRINKYTSEVNLMYLKRKIDTYLMNWKNTEDRKPLIVKGPRQIGKTESIRKCAEDSSKHFQLISDELIKLHHYVECV